MKPGIVSILVRFYRILLRLYPAGFQDEFGAEMEEVFATAVSDAGQAGPLKAALFCLKELSDLPAGLVDAYRLANVQMEVAVMNREVRWRVWILYIHTRISAVYPGPLCHYRSGPGLAAAI